jgi:hypothetical protein
MNIKKYFNFRLPTKEESAFLKILAMVLMTVDHIGFILFPGMLWLRIIGRLAFPIFAYQFGVSIKKTKHMEKMGGNLFIFALISQITFWAVNKWNFGSLNIFFTLFLAWLIIFLYKKFKKKVLSFLTIIPIFIFLLLPIFIAGFPVVDYGLCGVLVLLCFAILLESPITLNLSFAFLTLSFCFMTGSFVQAFCLLAVFLFYLRISFKKGVPNVFYYAYYPVHLTVLALMAGLFIE